MKSYWWGITLALGILCLIIAGGLGTVWLNIGGEPRKFWFWCEVLAWCGL